MASNTIDEYQYTLQSAGNEVVRALSDCNVWQDEVRKSYDNYVSEINYLMSGLSFHISKASEAISSADSVNVEKYKSELDELIKRVGSI